MPERAKSEAEPRALVHAPIATAGMMGELVAAFDWSQTALGPMDRWSFSLRSIASTLLHSRQPMFLWWGPQLVQIYNDAYVPSFGVGKHPAALGQCATDCWQEIWPIISPQIDDVMSRGRASWNEDHLVPIFRNQRLEEVYWTYGYSPVFDDDGSIGGTLVVCAETTARVVAERRLRTLSAIGQELARATDERSLLRGVAAVLQHTPHDVPFALVYVHSADGADAELVEAVGLSRDDAAQLLGAHFTGAAGLRTLREAADSAEPISIACARLPRGPWPEPASQLFVAGLRKQREQKPSAFLVTGISPHLPFDAGYREHILQIAESIALSHTRIDAQRIRSAVIEERNNLLLQAPVAISLVTGPQHVYELANDTYRKMVGEDRSLIGKTYLEAFPEVADTELPGILDRVYSTGEPFVAEEMLVPLLGADGALHDVYFRFNLQPVRNAAGSVYGMMTLAMDISDTVRARRVLEKTFTEREALLTQLKATSRAKDEFLAMLGHELRNPLSPIVTALDLKRMRNGGLLENEDRTIERQVKHLVRLVDDLLDVARITHGNVELRRETVDIATVVHKAVEISSLLFEERKHALTVEVAEDIAWFGDATRLAQVIANLLTNAARYTNPGGHVKLEAKLEGCEVVVRVSDDGLGIAPEMMRRIFEPFVQGARGVDRAQGGLGIGLALVKNLIGLHNGSVTGESVGEGRGSTFTIRLPVPDQLKSVPPAPPSRSSFPPTTTVKRILIVDDNVDAGELLASGLGFAGHDVSLAGTAESALQILSSFVPDVAVLDIGLPDMDGYELAACIRSHPLGARVRLIALTGYGQEHDRMRSRAAGFTRHLVKPVDFNELLALVSAD